MGVLLAVVALPAFGQLNENCAVSVLNRTVQVNPDGSWVLPNIPANLGQVRVRATCTQNGVTTSGQSDFFTPQANGVVQSIKINFGTVAPVPSVLGVKTPSNTLSSIGGTDQLTVTSTFPDGTTADLTASTSGTNYTTSNPAVATVSPDGLVTAVSSGTTIISAMNEGALGVIAINVVLSGASHGGIPDDWAIAHGLDPNDPAMPFEDPDHDGLTNLQEFQKGTDPHNPDTDGDGIPDGLEVALGGNPLNPNDFLSLLPRTLKSIQVVPPVFTINVNTLLLEGSQQLIVNGTLNDLNGTQIDLTSTRRGTNYSSSDLTVCNFGAVDGQIFGSNTGTCTITVTNSGFTTKATGTVQGFTPSEVSTLSIPGAVAVDVAGNFAYVAAGTNGLSVIDITDRTKPFIRGTLPGIGDAEGIRVAGEYAFIADGDGFLQVVHVLNPDTPSRVATLPIPGNPIALALHSNLAFIATQGGGVSVISTVNPAAPSVLTTFTAPASAVGVDFDTQRNLAAVAMGTAGLQLFDITNLASPQALGLLPGGNVRRVLLKFPAALLADTQRSISAVNIIDPKNPVLSSSLAPNLGGAPVDIASVGNIAITADISFGRAIPIVNVINPLQPQSLGFWTPRSPGFGSSIAMDASFGYLIMPAGTLRIFHYRELVDPPGTPPTASIASPSAGATVIERQTVPVTVIAADDVAVASVSLTLNGQVVDTLTSPPYQFSFQVPVGVSTVTVGAFAVDLAGDIGKALPVQLNVIPDPGTRVVGRVVDVAGNPLAGAGVTTFGNRSSVTASDGSFSITQVPTVLGNIIVTATFTQPDGSILKGISAPVAPIPLGTTQAGTITAVPVPVITSLSRKSALAGTQVTFHITGTTLAGSTFAFLPAASPAFAVKSSTIDPSGLSATLAVSVPNGIAGTFALVATNIAGSSNATITPANRFTVVNPASRADSDGDGFADVVEAFFGTDPLDANSIPVIPSLLGEAESPNFTLLNNASPAGPQKFESESTAFTVLNQFEPVPARNEAASASFTVLNGVQPGGIAREADSAVFSVQNNAPSVTPGKNLLEAESPLFSVQNAIPRAEIESLFFTVLNQSQTAAPSFHEAESMPFSLRNIAPPSPHVPVNIETESLPFSVLNASVTPVTSQLEAESSLFTVRNDSLTATRSAFEIESPTFVVLNNGNGNPAGTLEMESPAFSIRNTAPPPAPGGKRFEADSLPFTVLNTSQPAVRTAHEVESPLFSILNTGLPAAGFEAGSLAFTVLNSKPTPGVAREAGSQTFSVDNLSPVANVTYEAGSLIFSLLNNSPFVVPNHNKFEVEGALFSVRNALPRPEAESLEFTVLNRSLPSALVFRELESIPFSAMNTAGPPPHVAVKTQAESASFSVLNINATAPAGTRFESESTSFVIRNDSLSGTRSTFETESSSFSVLNANPGKAGGNFEAASQEFSVRNTIQPPAPGAQRFEADSLLFTLLNSSGPSTPVLHEAASQFFSTLNNSGASPGVSSLEADSNAFSLLNGFPGPAHTVEADSPRFTVRNTITIAAASRRLATQARNRKRARQPARRPSPVAALRTISSKKAKAHSKSTGNNNRKTGATSSQTASPVAENTTSNSNNSNSSNEQQRSQHVSPTLQNQQ